MHKENFYEYILVNTKEERFIKDDKKQCFKLFS